MAAVGPAGSSGWMGGWSKAVIQNTGMTQDQRGANRPVGKVRRNAPTPIHCAAELTVSSVVNSGDGGLGIQRPDSVLLTPFPPTRMSSSETNRPNHSSDLRQKSSTPIPHGSRDTSTSNVTK